MAVHLGAAGDDLSFAVAGAVSYAASDVPCLIMGWYMMPTLTATHTYFRNTGTWIMVAATTTELEVVGNGSTDSNHVSTDAGIVANTWYMIAYLYTATTNVGNAQVVWLAEMDKPPRKLTLTQNVAFAGTSAGAATCYWANYSSSTSQALAGARLGPGVIFCHTGATVGSGRGSLLTDSYSSISADDEERVLNRFVYPFWRGKGMEPHWIHTAFGGSGISYSMIRPEECFRTQSINVYKRSSQHQADPFEQCGSTNNDVITERGPIAYQENPQKLWCRR